MTSLNNMTLDEVIRTRIGKKGRFVAKPLHNDRERKNARSRVNLRGSRGFHFSSTPEGKWTHDKFEELESENKLGALRLGSNPNRTVRVLLSNLAPSVSTSDLEELFEPYNYDSVSVHYNEKGLSLGSADVHLKKKDAEKMINDLGGMAIDKLVVNMAIIDKISNLSRRVEIPAKTHKSIGPVGIEKKRFAGGFRSVRRKPFGRRDEHDDRVPEMPEGKGFKGGRKDKKPKISEEELNKQLDAYMFKGSKDENMENVSIF